MNRVDIIGRLTKDIELRTTTSGKSVVNFTLAVDRRKKDDSTDFISCVAWDKTAELLDKYVSRGDRLGICGHLSTRTYEDKHKEKRFVMELVADEVEFLSKRTKPTEEEKLPEVSDDDLPF